MTRLNLPEPRVWATLGVGTDKHVTLVAGTNVMHFYKGRPIAVVDAPANFVYYPDVLLPAETRQVTALVRDANAQAIRCAAQDFDFIVAQALLRVAMPLTRRPEEEKPNGN